MALAFSELQTVSKNAFDPNIHNNMYDKTVFFAKLKSKNKITYDGGIKIQFGIHYAKLNRAKQIGWRDQISFGGTDTRTAAVLEWAPYMADTTLQWDERVKNAGRGKIIDLAKDKAKELTDDLSDQLSTDLVTSTSQGTLVVVPLAVIVDSATTYGGVAVADAADWASQEDGSATTMVLYGTTSLSYYYNAATFGSDAPTMFLTTRDLLSKLESLLQPQVRYTSDEALDKKFPHVLFNGKPAFSDSFVPSGYFYGLDMDKFELVVKDGEDEVSDWFSLEQDGRPKTLAKWASWVGNLKCDSRKTSFKMTALDYTK
uniref:Putative capsid protein n=1 Tax=viral metagenome TaxID=1070528 RepID=A0A6M3L9L3_9ZZZZ